MKRLTEKSHWQWKISENQSHAVASLKWLRTYLHHTLHRTFCKTLHNKPYKTLLEVGCGGGDG